MDLITIDEICKFLKFGNFEFLPTQSKICFPIIQQIYYKMKLGVEFENINIDEKLLIDGHHRYLCSLLLNRNLATNVWSSPSNIHIYQWGQIQIDAIDWESVEIIQRHNLKDAAKSGLDIELFVKI